MWGKTYMKEICDEVWCQRTGPSHTAEYEQSVTLQQNLTYGKIPGQRFIDIHCRLC